MLFYEMGNMTPRKANPPRTPTRANRGNPP